MSFVKRHALLLGAASGAALAALLASVVGRIPQPLAGGAVILGVALWAAVRGKKRDASIYTRRIELEEYLKAEELEHRRRREQDGREG